MDICRDNRFEIIAKAKEHLLDATNIDTSPKEMEVLDDFLFRCWQMGWLDRYDRKESEWMTEDMFAQKGWICPKCGRVLAPSMMYCLWCCSDMKETVTTRSYFVTAKDEPQTERSE